ncbi:MAG: hypothetical protein WDZ52_04630 [Pseudohongiellaceae bacterium]
MHAVIETSDSSFLQHWNKLCANDPVQNPIYMQQRADSHPADDKLSPFTDRSFLLMSAEEPVFGCSLTLHRDEHGRKCIGYFGREASSHINQASMNSASNNFMPEAIRLLQAHINQLIEEIQPHAIDYLDPVSCGVMSPVTQVLLEKGATPVVQKVQVVDLSLGQRDMYRNMSKSCRGMVEWGRRNLEIEIVSGDHFDISLGDIAGTIKADNALTLEAMIKKGNGFLVQGRYKNQLVSSSLFVHNNKTCHFVFADVFAEKSSDQLERPLLHAPIWEAMLHGRNLQCSQFDFGNTSVTDSASNSVFAASCFGGESRSRLRVTLDR